MRYTSVSLPYHIGNGYFGGFLPLIAVSIAAAKSTNQGIKDFAPFMGLVYPVTVATITFIVGCFLRETKDNEMHLTESNQRNYHPAIFGGLIALTAGALVAADLAADADVELAANSNVQWFFRILALVIIVTSVAFRLTRQGNRRRPGRELPATDRRSSLQVHPAGVAVLDGPPGRSML
ncbi:MAG: hypothetical protein U0232_06390 [Thermomicrobiales bacterium]